MELDKVLVADDDEALLHLMVMTLQRRNYKVEGVTNGPDALQAMRAHGPFAVLVTDMMMPQMRGQDLMREARRLDPQMVMIVITAAGTIESAIAALRSDGAYDYLLKPLESMNQLALAVERAAAHRRLQQEREVLQARVQAEAEWLQALIANTGDAILSANMEDVLTVVNPAAARLLRRDDLVGRAASASLPAPLIALVANWKTVGGRRPTVVEIPWLDGSVQMVSLTPVQAERSDQTGWVMVVRDVTHLKQLDELKVQMLTETARRIRLPLAQAIGTLAELNALTAADKRAAEVVYRLTKVWGRIQDWVDDLLALVRIDANTDIRLGAVDVGVVLDEFRQSLAGGLTKERGLKLEWNGAPGLPQVRAEAGLLRRALQALVSRAAARSEPGGVIRLSARQQDSQVWIEVSDDGAPVSEADLPYLFERSGGRLGAGAEPGGLELAMVKTIMDRMGGQVWVGGQGAVGSCITVCLPAAARTG